MFHNISCLIEYALVRIVVSILHLMPLTWAGWQCGSAKKQIGGVTVCARLKRSQHGTGSNASCMNKLVRRVRFPYPAPLRLFLSLYHEGDVIRL